MFVEVLKGSGFERGSGERVGLSGCLWRLVCGVCREVEECVGVDVGAVRGLRNICVCACVHVHAEGVMWVWVCCGVPG